MSRSLGTLTLDLIAKTGGFESGMDRAKRTAERRSREIEREMKARADAVEKAWKNVGTAVTTVLGTLAVGATFNKFIQNTAAAEQEVAQLHAVLKSTGNAAGLTADQIVSAASRISLASTFSSGEMIKAQTALLAFTGIQGRVFEEATQAAADMATRTGMSVAQAAETIGRALDVPSQGLTALSRQGFRFSDETKKTVEALEKQGRTAEAQKIILDALNESYGGAAAAARDTFGGALSALKNTVNDLLTGGDGSLTDAKSVVEELNRELQDPRTKQAVDNLMASLVALSAWAVKAMTEVIQFSRFLGESVARAIHGSADVVERLDGQIADVETRIRNLRDELSRPTLLRANPFVSTDSLERELSEHEARLANLMAARNDFIRMQSQLATTPEPTQLAPITFTATALPPTSTGTGRQKPQLDPLADAAKAYARALDDLNRIQLQAETSGWNLSRAQSELLAVMTSPEWLSMPDTWKQAIVAQGEYAHEAELAAKNQQRLNELIDATPTAQLEKQRETMMFLAQAYEQGRISLQQYIEATHTALGVVPTLADDASKSITDMNRVAQDAAGSISRSFVDYLFDPMDKSIKDMLLNFVTAIGKMIAQMYMLQAVQAAMGLMGFKPFANGGAFSPSGEVTAFAKGGVVNEPTLFKFASGGSFKTGVMGEAGPEAILPLKRGPDGKLGVTSSGGRGDVNVSIVINDTGRSETGTGDGAGAAQVLARNLEAAVMKTLVEQKRPGGLLHS